MADGPTVRIADLDDARDRARFDEFVHAHPDGTVFHLSSWGRAVERGCGQRPHYLLAETGEEVTGVLPLIHVRSPLFGQSLISNAFAVQGGPLAHDAATHEALDTAAWAVATRLGVPALEYRNRRPIRESWPAKLDSYATFRRPLGTDTESNLKAIPRKQRAEVRRSLDFGLETTVGSGVRDLDAHFRVYAESVRNLGSPVFPKALFAALLHFYGKNADILTVSKDAAPVASVLSLYFRGDVLPYYGGGTAAARGLRANDHMYWQLMEHARGLGCSVFDFGRSKPGTGAYAFKKNWGFEPEPLAYEFRLADGATLPDVNPLNPKYRLMTETWQRLPLWLANRVGPLVARGVG